MADDVESYLWGLLARVQKSHILRNTVAAVVLLGLLGLVGKFVYDLLPRHYSLTITGGDLLGSRHYLARLMQEEAGSLGVSLKIVPTTGSEAALEAVNEGRLDLALIQGGLDPAYANVQHAATLPPELIHFMVRPNITDLTQIKGRLVNLGSVGGGTRVVSKQILGFSGLRDRIDYVETNYSNEELIAMRPDRLPDVIVVISYAPNDVVEFLVRERGYGILEMGFPPSLAVRLGWVADTRLLGYMYSITPPVPARDIEVVGVNLHLVANSHVEPRAVARVLEALYAPKTASRFGQKINDADILASPGFPVSDGTELYMARNDPFLPTALFDKLKSAFGLLMSVASAALIAYRWYAAKEPPPPPELADDAVKQCLGRVGDIDRELTALAASGPSPAGALAELATRLAEAKAEIMAAATAGKLADPNLVGTALLVLADTRRAMHDLVSSPLHAQKISSLDHVS